jgi:hypothetical protein
LARRGNRDHAADRCPIGSVLADQSGRDVCVAGESLPGGDPGGRNSRVTENGAAVV